MTQRGERHSRPAQFRVRRGRLRPRVSSPSATRRRTAGTTRCRSAEAVLLQQPGDRVDQDAQRQLAVAGSDQAGERRVDPDRPLQSAALPEPDHAGSAAPGDPNRSSVTSGATVSRAAQQVVVARAEQPLLRGQHRGDRRPEAVGHRPANAPRVAGPVAAPSDSTGRRRVITPKPIASTSRSAKSSSHAAYIEVYAAEPGGSPPSRAQVSAYSAGSCTSRWTTQPCSPLASSQPPTRSGHGWPRTVLPVAEQLSRAAGREHRADLLDQAPHDVVADQPAVPVGVRRRWLCAAAGGRRAG